MDATVIPERFPHKSALYTLFESHRKSVVGQRLVGKAKASRCCTSLDFPRV